MTKNGAISKMSRGRSTSRPPVPLTVLLLLISATICSTWWFIGRGHPRLLAWVASRDDLEAHVHRLPTVTGLLVNSTACSLPDYHHWDASVEALVRDGKRFSGCRQDFPVRLTQEGRLLRLSVEDSDSCGIRCCYRSVTRKDEGSSDDHYRFGDEKVCFGEEDVLEVNDEFIQVKCSCERSDAVIYEDFRAFVVPKANVTSTSEVSENGSEKLNVYLIGIDSVSRLQFKRFMPDIEALLASDFDAIPMEGLTKVGVNTFPNMLAFLAGIKIDEIKSLRQQPFDDLPFVWKDFSRLGYVTMFNEDTPVEAAFNYLKKGFFITPTDYYMRPFYRAIEDSRFVRSLQTLCVNQRAQLDLQLQWLQDLMSTQTTSAPQFALLFSSALSHEGPLPYVGAMQGRLEQFLRWYRDSPRHNTSVMLLFSDHGMRFGPIMRYELGGYESRLPFFYAILPPWYAARYPDRVAGLRANSRRLTTFFDVHATLRDLLRHAGAKEADLPVFRHPGVSLFQPVPQERSCDDAGIPTHWCVCRVRRPLPLDDAVIGRAAAAAVRHINTVLLRDLQVECAELELARVTAAYHSRSQRGGRVHDMTIEITPFEEYVVRFVTEPGAGEFEATVRAEQMETNAAEQTKSPGELQERRGEAVEDWPKTAEERANSAARLAKSAEEGAKSAEEGAKQAEEGRREASEALEAELAGLIVQEVSRLNLYRGQSDCLLTQWNERRFCFCRDLL